MYMYCEKLGGVTLGNLSILNESNSWVTTNILSKMGTVFKC